MKVRNKVTVQDVKDLIKYMDRRRRQVVTREMIEQDRIESLKWRLKHFGY